MTWLDTVRNKDGEPVDIPKIGAPCGCGDCPPMVDDAGVTRCYYCPRPAQGIAHVEEHPELMVQSCGRSNHGENYVRGDV